MKKLLLVFSWGLILSNRLCSQNLVPNYSFETYSACPNFQNELFKAVPWFNPSVWPSTPDYFNACSIGMTVPSSAFGFQFAKSGIAYTGIYVWSSGLANTREYLEVELIDTMQKGKEYFISFFVSLSEPSGYAINNLGIYFSDTAIYSSTNTNFPFTPQIENTINNPLISYTNWTQISGFYTANGGEKFIVIGNFHNDSLSNIVYVDTTQQQYVLSYYFIDDVTVIDADSVQGINDLDNFNFNIYPNPTTEKIKITTAQNYFIDEVEIFSVTGEMLLQQKIPKQLFNVEVDVGTLPKGIYIVKIKTAKGTAFKKLIKQ